MKRLILALIVVFTSSCSNTLYKQVQTEETSRVVYATKDSIDAARIDLASQYATEATRLVVPPKERIQIQSLWVTPPSSAVISPNDTKTIDKKKYVVVPREYNGLDVMVVGSEEYNALLKIKDYATQLETDNKLLAEAKAQVDAEIVHQREMHDKMIDDLNKFKLQVSELKLTLFKRNLALGLIVAAGAVVVFIKVRKLLPI